jgi:hypothetical protein
MASRHSGGPACFFSSVPGRSCKCPLSLGICGPIVLTLSVRYVAMHAMQEENHSGGHDHHSSGNGYAEGGSSAHQKQSKLQMRDTVATVVGFMLPLLTRFGHHHH